jgi:hypothetical protein
VKHILKLPCKSVTTRENVENGLNSQNVFSVSITILHTQMQTRYPFSNHTVNCQQWWCYMIWW